MCISGCCISGSKFTKCAEATLSVAASRRDVKATLVSKQRAPCFYTSAPSLGYKASSSSAGDTRIAPRLSHRYEGFFLFVWLVGWLVGFVVVLGFFFFLEGGGGEGGTPVFLARRLAT